MAVITKQIKKVPVSVPGEGMAEVVRRGVRCYKNSAAYSESSGAINMFELPGNSLVTKLVVNVSTAFDASGTSAAATGTITVPNDTGTITLLDAGNTKFQSSGFIASTGAEPVKLPSSGGMVIFTYTPGTTTA